MILEQFKLWVRRRKTAAEDQAPATDTTVAEIIQLILQQKSIHATDKEQYGEIGAYIGAARHAIKEKALEEVLYLIRYEFGDRITWPGDHGDCIE